MNYKHIYHAGSFADVFKHLVMIALIEQLMAKDKPFCIIDTHAGAGCYDLMSTEAQKSREYQYGILKIMQNVFTQKSIITLQNIVHQVNRDAGLHYYPGSPLIAEALLRPRDRMILIEKQPLIYQQLKQEFKSDARVSIHQREAYEALTALLPPEPKRGLVLIDPPYESKQEFRDLTLHLAQALRRWPQGIYAIWYPIKESTHLSFFYQLLNRLPCKEVIKAEINVFSKEREGLSGCGMAIVNPPWGFQQNLNEILQIVSAALKVD